MNKRLLSVILKIVTRPVSRNFAHLRRANLRRTFTTALPGRAPSAFSVSFAPEPDEPEIEALAPNKALAKNRKKEKRAAKKAEPAQEAHSPPEQEYILEDGSKESPDYAQAVAALEISPSDPQHQRTHVHAEEAGDVESGESLVTDPKERTVEEGPEDNLLIPDGLATESLASEDYLRAALRGEGKVEETTADDSQQAAGKEKKKEKARRFLELMREKRKGQKTERNLSADFLVGPGFVTDKTPVKRQTLLSNLSKTNSTKGAKQKQKLGRPDPRSSLAQENNSSSSQDPASKANPPRPPRAKKEPWQVQKQALQKKFGSEGWKPRKKLSPDTINGIRALHDQYPDKYPTPVLAEKFKVSPEAIRRILRSRWRPDTTKQVERRERWARRHDRIWDQQAAIGLRSARTKPRKPKEPGEVDEEAETEEVQSARARKQARKLHLTDWD